MIRILIASDHLLLRQGLVRMLADHADLSVIAEAGTALEVLRAVEAVEIDVALIDFSLAGCDSLELGEGLRRMRPRMRLLVLSTFCEDSIMLRALRASSGCYLGRENTARETIAAIRSLASPEMPTARNPGARAVAAEFESLARLSLKHARPLAGDPQPALAASRAASAKV